MNTLRRGGRRRTYGCQKHQWWNPLRHPHQHLPRRTGLVYTSAADYSKAVLHTPSGCFVGTHFGLRAATCGPAAAVRVFRPEPVTPLTPALGGATAPHHPARRTKLLATRTAHRLPLIASAATESQCTPTRLALSTRTIRSSTISFLRNGFKEKPLVAGLKISSFPSLLG